LLTTINREVDVSTTNLQKMAVSSAEEMRHDLAMAMEEVSYLTLPPLLSTLSRGEQIKEEVLRHGQGIGDEVTKASENTAHSLAELTKQIDRVRRKLDGESSALREGHQVMELEIAVSDKAREFT
jgi:hypothetical protein